MSVFELPPAYPALMPPGTSGPHHQADECKMCGTPRTTVKCPTCGMVAGIDCRNTRGPIPYSNRMVTCEHPGCISSVEPGADAHDTWDGHDLHHWCLIHCPECT